MYVGSALIYFGFDFIMVNVDPYDVLNIPHNFTLEQLKAAYYTQALKVHPDKGGSKELFQLVTNCFRELYKQSTESDSGRQHHDLKKAYDELDGDAKADTSSFYEGKQFNNSKFQQLYEKVRPPSMYDKGYVDEMKNEDIHAPQVKGKVTVKNLNKRFEQFVTPSAREMVVFKQPEAFGVLTKLNYETLGADDVKDFSGDNGTLHKLNYMDFKVAHTTSRLVDPKTDKRPTFKTLEELKKHRESMKLDASEEEQRELDERQAIGEREEEDRVSRLRKEDTNNFKYWKTVRQQTLKA